MSYGLDTSQEINWVLGVILYGVVVIYCWQTFNEERKALAVMDSLRGMMAKTCTVVRGGVEKSTDPALLVPGDVVRLRLGQRVPADVRVLVTRDLKTEVRAARRRRLLLSAHSRLCADVAACARRTRP
jgi:sodium/potassium-transporting ATPase subunit alpha